MNPFDIKIKMSRPGTYKAFVEHQVSTLGVGDSKMVNLGEKGVKEFRMNLQKVSVELCVSFKTLVDTDGCLWVKRVE